MGSNTAKTVQDIIKHGTLFQTAFSLAETLYVANLQFVAKSGDHRAKRCHTLCSFSVIIHKCIAGYIDLFTDCIHNHIQFIPCSLRKCSMIVMHFIGHMCNIRCMISNSLKVIDRMKIQGCLTGLCRIHLTFGKLDQIFSQSALVLIDQIFFTLYLIIFILLIIIQKIHSTVYVLTKLLCHTIHGTVTLSHSKCRIIEQTFFQKIEICLVFQFFCTVFYQIAYQLLDLRNEWEKNNYSSHTENGIQKCDGNRAHDHIHKSEMHDRIQGIEDDRPQDQTK